MDKYITLNQFIEQLNKYTCAYGDWELRSIGWDSNHNHNIYIRTDGKGETQIDISKYINCEQR